VRAGLDPAYFWDLCPREAQAIMSGAQHRARDAHNHRAWLAWQTAMLPHQKQPPKYSDLVMRDLPRQRSNGSDWERQFAEFSTWTSIKGR